jgi:diguanylate cyclase (GGDEF)-like protein/putative nucleotidyltransferase with HDIG domain
MKDLPLAARLHVWIVLAAGTLVLALFAPRHLAQPALFFALLLLSSLASALKVSLPLTKSGSTMSVSYAVDFASLLLLGADDTMLVAGTSAWSQCTFRMQSRNPQYRTLYSMASLVLTVKAAGLVYLALGGARPGEPFSLWTVPKPLVGAATAYFVCNTTFIASAIGLSTGQPIGKVWNENFLWSAPSYFVGASAAAVAAAAAVVDRRGYWVTILASFPLYLTYRTYKVYMDRVQDEQRHVQEVSDLHLATVEALALAIDAKDQTAQSHIRRVQQYAVALAKVLGMGEPDIQGVKTAALLHDIGKLAVPEHILSKPGPLTQEEFQRIRIHPQVGAEIIGGVPFPYPVAPLILSHHERWDGKGYPAGLQGEEIPLGARILSVVDYFDTLISERPYHKAMSLDAAIGLLRQEAGKALDPRVVQVFIDMNPATQIEVDGADQPRQLTRVAAQTPAAKPAVGLVTESAPQTSVFQDIAHAHREIYALYEIAQAMGSSLGIADTMALISSKLSNIVPFSCCALFLYNDDTDSLHCRFAAGIDSDLIQQLTIRSGQGLTGWVARNRRPLVNARPSTDLEASNIPADGTTLQSALVCPLVFNDRFIGTISVYHTESSIYTDDHRRLLDRISEQAAAVIYNSIVFEQTQEDSLTDPLTGLPNTRSMFMHLTRELARAERLLSEVSLLVTDVDHFKDINDTYGHHIGDRALREIAKVLRAGIRPYDMCVRYAGDEFIVVLSGCGGGEAERKRLELQEAVRQIQIEPRPGRFLSLSISVGAAVFPHDGKSYEQLLAAADGRMYRDKTRRKRPPGGGTEATDEFDTAEEPAGQPAPSGFTDRDLEKAAAGVL